MPELPEVEVIKQSLDKKIKFQKINKVVVRNRNLRFKISKNFEFFLRNKKIIIPNSETIFEENDDVVFFSETDSVKKLEKLLSIRQQFS